MSRAIRSGEVRLVVRGLLGTLGKNQEQIPHPRTESNPSDIGYLQELLQSGKPQGATAVERRRRRSPGRRLKPNLSGDC
jgi:hypothetical protein